MKKLRGGRLKAFVSIRPALEGFVSSGLNAATVPWLCQKLRDPAVTLSLVERELIADLLEGKLKLSPRSPVKTYLRHLAIAQRVEELMRDGGKEQKAAVSLAMGEFRCSRRTVMTALKKCN